MIEQVLGALSVLAMGALKFLFAAPLSYGLGFGFLGTLTLLLVGGGAGMTGFFFAGARVMEWFRVRHLRREHKRLAKGLPPDRIFTRTNRFIVRMKHLYGVRGLAALAPPILSIPVTALLAAKYFRHERRTLPTLLASVLVWSGVLSLAWAFLR
jgi:hypothetical protein